MSVEVEDEFQKELIEVFIQEAQEWLEQIHVALDELQQDPPRDRRLKLVQTIKAGLGNLGGSAATVNLNDIAQATFSTLPYIENLDDPSRKLSPDDFVSLCKQLGQISAGLTQATAVSVVEGGAAAEAKKLPTTIPVNDLLAVLHQHHARQPKSGALQRNVIQTVIAQMEGLKRNGVGECDVASMHESLTQAGAAEDKFLQMVRQRIPAVIDELGRLKNGASATGSSPERLKAVVEQVAQLRSTAQEVNAPQAMVFFKGLHSFLMLIQQRRVVVASKRYEAVEARLSESAKAIQNWVETGRAERSAIGGLLPN
jgi:chemotaxis protein histidine kinase CheA